MDDPTRIIDLPARDPDLFEQLAHLLHRAFRVTAPRWLPTLEDARQEIRAALKPGKINRLLVDAAGRPLGWVGVIPHDDGGVWELHPVVVREESQGQGYGRRLLVDIETLAVERGVRTIWLSTSDETRSTSLGGVDLYPDPLAALARLRTLEPHPVDFYRKLGYSVVGVLPDAEGPGMPSITFARRVGR